MKSREETVKTLTERRRRAKTQLNPLSAKKAQTIQLLSSKYQNEKTLHAYKIKNGDVCTHENWGIC